MVTPKSTCPKDTFEVLLVPNYQLVDINSDVDEIRPAPAVEVVSASLKEEVCRMVRKVLL